VTDVFSCLLLLSGSAPSIVSPTCSPKLLERKHGGHEDVGLLSDLRFVVILAIAFLCPPMLLKWLMIGEGKVIKEKGRVSLVECQIFLLLFNSNGNLKKKYDFR
jgi:hypothetical protein